jgi:uncharacterized protein (UPF0548 family)
MAWTVLPVQRVQVDFSHGERLACRKSVLAVATVRLPTPWAGQPVSGVCDPVGVVTLLSDRQVSELRAAPFTYDEVGATAAEMPSGYQHLVRSRLLHSAEFDEACDGLMTWRMHELAGLRVEASSARVQPGAVVRMLFGVGPASLSIPCRVVYVVEESDRVGFAYGTLTGHPECGEELFAVERRGDGAAMVVRVFSKPATFLARAGGPVTRRVQSVMTDRYLRALDRS